MKIIIIIIIIIIIVGTYFQYTINTKSLLYLLLTSHKFADEIALNNSKSEWSVRSKDRTGFGKPLIYMIRTHRLSQ